MTLTVDMRRGLTKARRDRRRRNAATVAALAAATVTVGVLAARPWTEATATTPTLTCWVLAAGTATPDVGACITEAATQNLTPSEETVILHMALALDD